MCGSVTLVFGDVMGVCMGSVGLEYGEVIGLTRCRGSVSLAYGQMDVGNGLVWIPIPWKVRLMMW